MKKKIRILALTLCVILAMTGLAGCGGNSANNNSSAGSNTAGSSEATGGGGAAGGNNAVNIRFGHADSESSVFHAGAMKFKEEVEKNSGGSITVEIFPSGQLGTLREMTEAVQMGTLDMTVAASSVLANFAPDIAVYDLPFLLDNYEHAYATLDGDVGKHLDGQLLEQNLISLGWWQIGFRNVTCNREIHSVDDLAGLRIRTMASTIYQEMLRELGVDPVPMDWGETFTALQQGTVDGQENPYTQILDASIYEVNKYAVETEHTYTPAAMMISPKTWDKLSDEQKGVVTEAAKAATQTARQESESKIAAAKKTLTEEHGMTITNLDKAELKEKVIGVYDSHPELAELVAMCDSYRK